MPLWISTFLKKIVASTTLKHHDKEFQQSWHIPAKWSKNYWKRSVSNSLNHMSSLPVKKKVSAIVLNNSCIWDKINVLLLYGTIRKICKNTGFLWHAFLVFWHILRSGSLRLLYSITHGHDVFWNGLLSEFHGLASHFFRRQMLWVLQRLI